MDIEPLTPTSIELAATFEAIDHYAAWQRSEGVPSVTGFYIEDLKTVEVHPWDRKGGRGVFLNLEGAGNVCDAAVIELSPGGASDPERHIYEELVYVLSGRGSTSVWYDPNHKQTFEWGEGSLFAIPLNANYQHFNGSGQEPARYIGVTNAPMVLRQFHNLDFVFRNPFTFTDRFSGQDGYFNGTGELFKRKNTFVWQTNFVSDVRRTTLHTWKERGGGGSSLMLELADNSMGAHIAEFEVGMYKKAHRHGPGFHVIMLSGVGYSLLWREGEERVRCDWRPGSVVVPPDAWFHEHFNTGPEPARYIALWSGGLRHTQATDRPAGSDVSVKEGGWQIEYEDEDPAIHQEFEEELRRQGGRCHMRGDVPGCTGDES